MSRGRIIRFGEDEDSVKLPVISKVKIGMKSENIKTEGSKNE